MKPEDENLIVDHDYDGIQELDNPLPDWWLITFLATIMFAFFYFIHFEIGGGQTIAEELQEDIATIDVRKNKNPAPADSDEDLTQLLNSAAILEQGKAVYLSKCLACHGPELQGLIGPNLTDDFWIHGHGKPTDIAMLVRKGVLEKGMPQWDGMLKDEDIRAVTVFVVSRRGTNPANPKPPQGEKIGRN